MKFICTILFVSICSFAQANEYKISSVKELNDVQQKVHAGDIIVWQNGNYEDVKINFQPVQNGTEKQPIILKAETAGKVVFKGASQLFVSGIYLQAEGFLFEGTTTIGNSDNVIEFAAQFKDHHQTTHCRITNCAIINYSPNNIDNNTNYVTIRGTFNELDHCYFTGKINRGPIVVVRYKTDNDFIDGSDMAPSTHHHIHHNYFGYRTFPENGGEDMRVGDSKTSFTHGFNIIEYNYFEDERLEAEVISNKSWDNIYRFNSFIGNDGAMVLRHGQKCFVYGNYIDGKTGRNKSGGIRVINANQTVFNNYVENVEGGIKDNLKGGLVIMCGLENSAINGYYPADSAIVAFNTVVNCIAPSIKIGVGNKNKGEPFIAPKNIYLVNNVVINSLGESNKAAMEYENVTYLLCKNNFYTNGGSIDIKGFEAIKEEEISKIPMDEAIINLINKRLAIHNIHLTKEEITHFNPNWKLSKKDVGVSWIH